MNREFGAMNRREVLSLGAAASAAVIAGNEARSQADELVPLSIIDTNISLFQWPFRRLPLDEPPKLVAKLRSLGITQAWASSFEALLHRDITQVNHRLVEACQPWSELVPIGAINLELPTWEADLRRCFEEHAMPGVRVHPNYHGYTLDDLRFFRLIELATAAGRFVQLCVAMEDTRTQHPLVRVADVDLAPLPGVITKIAEARVQLLNYRPTPASFERLKALPQLYFDTARVEATDGVPELVKQTRPGHVLFGSHASLLVPEAALIRVTESGSLDAAALRLVFEDNARRFSRMGSPA